MFYINLPILKKQDIQLRVLEEDIQILQKIIQSYLQTNKKTKIMQIVFWPLLSCPTPFPLSHTQSRISTSLYVFCSRNVSQ